MAGTYAQGTSVDSAKSRAEIERTLDRYGATQFAYASSADKAMVEFIMADRRVRFVLALPDKNDREFRLTETGRTRTAESARTAYEAATRQKWRALALVVKAKLEAVESGIAEFEAEFAANIVLSDNRTVYDHIKPSIAENYRTGNIQPLMQIES